MKTIVFDFDGTIADSFGTLVGVFEEITNRKQKLKPDEIEDLRRKSLKEVISYLKIKSWQIPRLLIKARQVISIKIDEIKPFRGLPPVLKRLHGEDYQMFILSTNSSENISKFLRANGMGSYFVKIYGGIGLRSKASALKKVLRRERIQPDQCVYVGDEVRDVEAGQKVGIPQIAVGWGFNHPETLKHANPSSLATKPQDLLTILKRH